jgi:quercetin dioxygenase-like cupin family protein
MPVINFDTKKKIKIWEGITGAVYHSDKITCGHILLDEGVELPEHKHIYEQWTHLIAGELLLVIGGEKVILKPGMCAYIPSDVLHSGKALKMCKAIDVFSPPRQDWVELERNQLGS